MLSVDHEILVVDDEKEIRDILLEELCAQGARARGASSVADAMGALRERRADLVISDIRMPGAGGLELLRQVRDVDAGPPVVLITGFADISLAEAHSRGAEAVLNKPFDLDEVCETCLRLVRPIPERWPKRESGAPEHAVRGENLVVGRGGFLVKEGPRPTPRVGQTLRLRVIWPDGRAQTFETVCRWSVAAGWGAEIVSWDEASAAVGWEHAGKTSFIPLA